MRINKISWSLSVLFLLYYCDRSSRYFVETTLRRFPTIVTYPQVEISTGTLRGSFGTSREGREFYQFLGVPYGETARFEPSVPARKWSGIKRADRHRTPCLQLNWITGLISGDEDCLYLNVFVPNVRSEPSLSYELNIQDHENNRADDGSRVEVEEVLFDLKGNRTTGQSLLPVMVFIYGGFFMYGSARLYGPEYFMDEDVILVTFNYRVGALGFLNTGDGLVKGNMGLKDQVLVLKWIQQNIAYFGGDPKKVTIMGESAGASSVHYHILSKMTTGLFHKAISQSGSAIRTWQLTYRPAEQARRLAIMLNCTIVNPNAMVNCLKNIDGTKIVTTHYERVDVLSDPLGQYAPTLEMVNNNEAFMTEHPLSVLKSGNFNHVPWLIGCNKDEGLIYSARIKKHTATQIKNDWQNVAPILLNYNSNRTEVASMIKRFYLDRNSFQPSSLDFWKDFSSFTDMFSDRFYLTASRLSAQEHAKYAPTFTYYFTYQGEYTFYDIFLSAGTLPRVLELGYSVASNWVIHNVFRRRRRPKYGVSHGDDLIMLYNFGYLAKVRRKDVDYDMSRSMIRTFVNFATDHKNLRFRNHVWLPIDSKAESPIYMNLDTDYAGMIREPFTDRAKFWESIGIIL